MMASSAGEACGASVRRSGGSVVITARLRWTLFSAANAGLPVMSWNITAPSDQRSARASTSFELRSCSGAM